jgi:hypothetical protein
MQDTEKQIYKGFTTGYNALPIGAKREAENKLCNALNINNRNSLYEYRTGKREPKISQAEAVAQVFLEYGITNIWD